MRSDAARQRAGSVWSADFFLPPQVSGGKIALGKNPRGARGNSFGLSIPDFESSLRLLFCHMFFAVVIKNTFCACAQAKCASQLEPVFLQLLMCAA